MDEVIMNPVMKAVLSRRSTRSFTDEQISEAELKTILEAGIWAPSARNTQQIRFFVLQDREKINKIAENFSNFAFNDGKVRNFAYSAPTVILLFGQAGARFMHVDAGIAVENMSLAAESLGLGSLIIGCIKEYFESPEGRKFAVTLGIPEDLAFGISLAVGHIANPTPEKPRLPNRVKFI